MLGLIGKKIGMTRLFTEVGHSVAVTLIQAGPCTVIRHKNQDEDNYSALQVGYEDVAESKLNKPDLGHYKKYNVPSFKIMKEFRVNEKVLNDYSPGSELKVDIFNPREKVHITGISKGKGFSGVIKRHNFHGKNKTHGTHEIFRGTGSVGMCATPSRIFRGKKMPGQYGNEKVTVRNLTVYKIDSEKNILMVNGAVPGHRNSVIKIQKAR